MPIIAPNKIRFIKLGSSGEWEQDCIRKNTIRLCYKSPHHEESLVGDWDIVRNFLFKL
jgi:hypothetical protein